MTQVGWIHLTITKCFTHTTLREGETNVLNPVVRPMTQVVGFTSLLPSVSHTHNFERGGNQCLKSDSMTNDTGGWIHLTITKCFTHTTLREGQTNVLNPVV